MRTVLLVIWRYLRAFVIIYLCLYAGNALALLLPVTIPGSIIGMLILFFLLAFQLLPPDWVRPGSLLLIRYMALLFVPISVGVMGYTDLLSAQFGPIVVSCVVSTFIVLLTVGLVSHKLHGKVKGVGDE
ncbi:MAG TPA: murein hydrolase regulator LrgA [Erwinia sp.]|uniref:CidA/LrgA family protein n=1 Tax=Erwinia citreus TaxID=558 RepID=UPI000E97D21C|nr:CidA/LrgA family protein [Erwinia sp.]HBV40334.1 murein hydrolase regulator LrgA [Erwinia sp.]